jgi:hypothetical protein
MRACDPVVIFAIINNILIIIISCVWTFHPGFLASRLSSRALPRKCRVRKNDRPLLKYPYRVFVEYGYNIGCFSHYAVFENVLTRPKAIEISIFVFLFLLL